MNSLDKEQYLINQLTSKHIGDDGALIGDTLYSMDAFFEDVHFKRAWMSMAQIGRKAMLVNLSDAIAMNASAQYALVTVSLPRDLSHDEIDALTKSMQETASEFGCEIIGGDTIGGEKLHLSITIIAKSDAPLLRKGVECGDILAYTGTLGESKRDLEALFRGECISEDSRFYRPTLRQAFIAKARPYLHAGMDISDGLFCDTHKLLKVNELGLKLKHAIAPEIGESGEEYEMLIAFAPQMRAEVERVARETGTTLTLFATVVAEEGEQLPCASHHFKD